MKAFIGINMAMGFHSVIKYKDYWCEDKLLQVPCISNVIPRTRYEKLCQYMHVNDPRLQDNNDKILKVRNFVTRLIDRFQMSFKQIGRASCRERV